MISKEFFAALDELTKSKNVDKEVIISTLESALTASYKKNFNEASNAMVKLDSEKKTIKFIKYKVVVEELTDPEKEILLPDAKKIKRTYKIGDRVEEEVAPKDFGRIAAQTAKQVVMQKVREIEKANTIEKINSMIGTFVRTRIVRIDGDNVYVKLDEDIMEGLLTKYDQIPGETYANGMSISVYIKGLKDSPKAGPIAQVTRTGTRIVSALFTEQIPEIQTGEIEIVSISREAGVRTKIAIRTNNEEFDPIGACIGNRSVRINSIIKELNNEKIDIVLYSDNPEEYIENALSPAKPTRIEEVEEGYVVYVPNDKLSLAVGKGGINVKLAAKLTGYKIDIHGTDDYNEMIQENQVVVVDEDYEDNLDLDYEFEDEDIDNLFADEE